MLKHGILKNGLLNNDSVISIILNISEESVNNKRVVVNRFFTHVQDDKLYNDIIKQYIKYPISYHPPESLPAYKWHPDSKGRHHWY